ncbi:HNH endonuclease [Shimia thalassica]|nr:HNH endonuclease [Shimia thalassica]MDO6520731.1 HNH endonuclease [Shimia thalassica]
MGLSDITATSISVACDEYDELGKTKFLKKYGFGASKKYHLRRNGNYYDSKAIVGAAHGHLGPSSIPLRNTAFSGGQQHAVQVLEDLGFEVVENPPPTRNPDWSRDELILATEFYLRHAPSIPGKTTKALTALADEIRTVATLQSLRGNETFRNPNGVYMKLMELRKYDDSYHGIGLGHERVRDVELEVFTLPEAELLLAARDIRSRIRTFRDGGGQVLHVERPLPNAPVLRELLASDDALENQLAEVLIDWQETKRAMGRYAGLGRDPGKIRQEGARTVVEKRVRSRSSGFDEVSSSGQSYEKIVVDHADQFPDEVVKIAQERLADFELVMPTDDRTELDARVGAILSRPEMLAEPPAGNPRPRKELAVGTAYVRDPRVVAYTQTRAAGVCELCREEAPFRKSDGTPYLETHHVQPLAEGGPDTVENCAAVCPNCHRALHSAENRNRLAEKLHTSIFARKG